MYEMDGVMVCADRPSRFTSKVMSKYDGRLDLVHFVELMSGEDQRASQKEVVRCPVYDLERLLDLIEDGLHKMATRHGGEEHFMMFDDVSGLGYYHNPKALNRFFVELAEDLEEHGIMHVAVVAKEEQGLLSRWTGSAFQARLNVKPSWLMAGTLGGRP
jgi:hypothetical protein